MRPSPDPRAATQRRTGHAIAIDTLWNLLGLVGPMLVAIWAIPILVRGLGTDRFGLMAIVWMVVGYFNLFDLGIGRALTKVVAVPWRSATEASLPALTRRGMRMMGLLGVVGGVVIAALSPWLAGDALHMPAALRHETLYSFFILAATLPFVILSAGSVGILQGFHRFREVTWVRLPQGVLNYAAPVAILAISHSLVAVTLVVAASRIVATLAYSWLARVHLNRIYVVDDTASRKESIKPLLQFGGWVTVSNVVGPVLVFFDRFLIGALVGVAAVAYYTTPFTVVSRFSLLPGALLGVLFPAMTATLTNASGDARRLYGRAWKTIALVMVVPVAWTVLFASDGLRLWVGATFAAEGAASAQWLVVGVFLNAVAGLPFVVLQGSGRPDLTAKAHVAELLVYVPALWFAVVHWGIVGAAAVWTLRHLVDLVALSWLCGKHVPAVRDAAPAALRMVLPTAVCLLALALVANPAIRIALAAAITLLTTAGLWITLRQAGLWPVRGAHA